MSTLEISTEEFRNWVANAEGDHLATFIDEILPTILDLEEDDFFGTEGWMKRFA